MSSSSSSDSDSHEKKEIKQEEQPKVEKTESEEKKVTIEATTSDSHEKDSSEKKKKKKKKVDGAEVAKTDDHKDGEHKKEKRAKKSKSKENVEKTEDAPKKEKKERKEKKSVTVEQPVSAPEPTDDGKKEKKSKKEKKEGKSEEKPKEEKPKDEKPKEEKTPKKDDKKKDDKPPAKLTKSESKSEVPASPTVGEPTLQTGIQHLAESSETSKFADLLRKDESIKANKIVPGLVEALKKNSNDLGVVNGVHLAIKFMKDRDGLRISFRENHGFPILIDLLSNKNSKIRRTSVRFIGDLITKNKSNADNTQNAIAFVESKGIEAILKTMQDEEQEIQIMSAGVVRVVAGYEGGPSCNLQDAVRSAGGVPVLVKFVSLDGSNTFVNDMTRQAATAIRNMCTNNVDNQNAFIDNNLISTLVKKLTSTDEVKVKQALYATLYAVCIGNEKSLKTLVSEKVLEIFAKEVKTEVNEDALEALLVLIAGLSTANASVQVAFREHGVVEQVVKLSKEEIGPIKEKKTLKAALESLAALANDNTDITKYVVEHGMVDRILSQLSKELTNPIISAYLHLLRVLAYGLSTVQEAIAKSDHFSVLFAFVTSDSVVVQEHALEIFRTCRLNAAVKVTLEKNVGVLIDLLVSSSPSVQESAVTCIEHVVNSQEEALTNLRKEKKIVGNLTAVLDRNHKEKLIIRACVLIDKLLTGTSSQISFPKLQEQFAKYGAVQKLVAILSTNNSEKTKDHATYTLWALVANNEKVQKEAKKARAIESLVDLLASSDNSESLKEFAAGALSATLNNSASNRKLFLTSKGLDHVVKLIGTASGEKFKINLTNTLALAVEDNAKAQDLAKDALPHVIKNIGSGSALLQAASARAVSNLVNKNVKLQDSVRDHSGIFKTIVHVLQKFSQEFLGSPEDRDKADVVLYLLTLVVNLSTKNKANTDELAKEGAVDVVDLLKDSKNKPIAKLASTALTNLGVGKGRSRTMSSATSSKSSSDFGKKEVTDEKPEEKKKEKKTKKPKESSDEKPLVVEEKKSKKDKKKKTEESGSSDEQSDQDAKKKKDEEKEPSRKPQQSIMVEVKKEESEESGSASSSSDEEPQKQPEKKEEEKPKKVEEKKQESSGSSSDDSDD